MPLHQASGIKYLQTAEKAMCNVPSARLAIHGGSPVWNSGWPKWPRADAGTERVVLEALHSGRWSISGCHTGVRSFERRFAEEFAAYNNSAYCVPTASGSASLSIALEAVGVRHGDEVLVPGLTWVACASSVAALGAVPVLVDIEPDTLCMSVDAARKATGPKTAAIMLVHLYGTVGNLDAFVALAEEHEIPLIEDCAQAHGARWRGRRVGTHGKVGAFSMQHSKVLTSGEGGAVITDDFDVYERMQQLRADGRRYCSDEPRPRFMELEEVGQIQGRNRCLSELQAAILLDRLQYLDAENSLREVNGEYLGGLLQQRGLAVLQRRPSQVESRTFYHFCVRLCDEAFCGLPSAIVAEALTAELGVLVELVDDPLNRHRLYNPLKSPRTDLSSQMRYLLDPSRFDLPNCDDAKRTCLTLPHAVLLANKDAIDAIATAFEKVAWGSKSLAQATGGQPSIQATSADSPVSVASTDLSWSGNE